MTELEERAYWAAVDRAVRAEGRECVLRAKLMRERAARRESEARELVDFDYTLTVKRRIRALNASARRLRAKAERVERGAP